MAGSAFFLLFVGLVVGVQSEISNQSALLDTVNASERAGGQPLVVGPSRQLMLRFVQGTHTVHIPDITKKLKQDALQFSCVFA